MRLRLRAVRRHHTWSERRLGSESMFGFVSGRRIGSAGGSCPCSSACLTERRRGAAGRPLDEDGGMLWSRTRIPWPMFNGAIATPALGPETAERAVAELAGAGLPWFAGAPDTPASVVDAAAQAGAIEFDHQAPWMEARIADLEDPELPAGVTIEEVHDEAGHRLWAATLREIYEFPELGEQAWTMPGELCGWSDLPWRQWIAFVDESPPRLRFSIAVAESPACSESGRRASAGAGSGAWSPASAEGIGSATGGFFSTPKAGTCIEASASSREDGSAADSEACPTRKRSITPAAPRALTLPDRDIRAPCPFARDKRQPEPQLRRGLRHQRHGVSGRDGRSAGSFGRTRGRRRWCGADNARSRRSRLALYPAPALRFNPATASV